MSSEPVATHDDELRQAAAQAMAAPTKEQNADEPPPQPEISEADWVRVDYALRDISKDYHDSLYLAQLFEEHSKGNQDPLISVLREAMAKSEPFITGGVEFFQSFGLAVDEVSRKESILKAMGDTPFALGAAWRESLESIKPAGQIETLTRHGVPKAWMDWYATMRGLSDGRK